MGYRLKSKLTGQYVSTYDMETDKITWADDMASAAFFTLEADAKDILSYFSFMTRLTIKIVEENG